MFTGLVQAVGTIHLHGERVFIEVPPSLFPLTLGESISVDGVCLTVDKTGHDYLKTMCQDMAYEVLDDIHILPERLLYLYRRLTT